MNHLIIAVVSFLVSLVCGLILISSGVMYGLDGVEPDPIKVKIAMSACAAFAILGIYSLVRYFRKRKVRG